MNNFQNNNINWKKGKIRKLLYSIRDEKYPKDINYLNDISKITIKLSDNLEIPNESFCISKGEFIYFKKIKILKNILLLNFN